MTYRADIDGLRAIAILSIVLFHIDSAWLPGGFIGVDVFFVISGFLITGNIIGWQEAGRFRVGEFYRRRIKRILPALSLVVASTLLVAQFVLLPGDLERLAYSAVASQLSMANVYFTYFLDTSYFAKAAALEPLLHVWSLGVEEQFYFFWPLLIVAGFKRLAARRLIVWIGVAAVASFALGEVLLGPYPMFSYYMLPTRFGELCIGALAYFAIRMEFPQLSDAGTRNAIAAFGALLIGVSLVVLNESRGFPGFNAIPVTAGTGLIIFANAWGPTVIGRLLALRPMVGIGLISYSMYLWHWPILAFVKYANGVLTTRLELAVVVLLVLLSILSYVLVEKPARRSSDALARVFLKQFAAPTAAITAVAVAFVATSGLGLFALDPAYRVALDRTPVQDPAGLSESICGRSRLEPADLTNPHCVINGTDEPRFLLWGDSHGAHYVGVIGELARQEGFAFRNFSHHACPPLLEAPERFARKSLVDACAESNRNVRARLDRYDTILIAGSWREYLAQGPDFAAELEDTVRTLASLGKKVVLLGQVPWIESLDRECARKALKLAFLDCTDRWTVPRAGADRVNRVVRAIADRIAGADYFDVNDVLCVDGSCSPFIGDELVYFDDIHLSRSGSVTVGRRVSERPDARRLFDRIVTTAR